MKSRLRSGQAIIFVTLSLFLLFSITGLSVDLGFAYMKRMQLQTAADAAAMGAAMYAYSNGGICTTAVPCGTLLCSNPNVSPAITSLQAGCIYAGVNGVLNGGNNGAQAVTMSANNTAPTNSPGLTSATYWTKASVSEHIPGLFLSWAGFRTDNITAEATAAIAPSGGFTGTCVYVLNKSNVANPLVINGGLTINADCGIYDNSSPSSTFSMGGGDTLHLGSFNIVGGYSNTNGNTVTPTPTTGVARTADPFASLPAPTFTPTSCDFTNYTLNASGTVSLTAGVYCGGITVNGGPYTLNFGPGNYILYGGGLQNNGVASYNGTGVMFYNSGTSSTARSINWNGNATLNVSAPSSGTFKGILVYTDRNVSGFTNNFNGVSTGATGTIYCPTTGLTYNGAQNSVFQAIIADTLTFNGNSNLKKDTSGTYTGLAKSTVGMVE